jgi:hypothetical protein
MTYALLIYRAAAPLPAEERAALAAHRALQSEAGARGELHAVARLVEPERARTVRRAGAAHDVSDGPYIEAKEWLVGFYLVDCASEAEALARAKAICRDDAHAIEVRPVSWRWTP